MYGMKKNKKMMNEGGKMLKDVPKGNKGLGKLPKSVRNDMGFKKDGGMMPNKKKMMGGGMAYGKKKMMDGGNVSKGGNERLYPYGKTNLLG